MPKIAWHENLINVYLDNDTNQVTVERHESVPTTFSWYPLNVTKLFTDRYGNKNHIVFGKVSDLNPIDDVITLTDHDRFGFDYVSEGTIDDLDTDLRGAIDVMLQAIVR
jgi:hypothetical protein